MFQIFIDNEEVVCESNFTIEEELMNPSFIELYKVYPKAWKGTNKLFEEYYFPKDYTKCKILRDGKLYFVGIVKNSADMELNPLKPHYCSLQILDPSILLSEGETLEYVIANKRVKEAILQVIESISNYGFVAGNISIPDKDNTLIGAYSTLDKTPYDVFGYFSIVSGTRWGTRMIDENTTAIDFYSPELLEDKGIIELTREYCSANKIEDFKYDYSTTDYRNKQIITSDEVFASIPQNETTIADGYKSVFTTEQKIGKINSIAVNGIFKTFALKNEKEIGVDADFYYEVTTNEIEASEVYSVGSNVIINYVPIIKGREISYNHPEISRIRSNIGREGTISRYENRNDITNSLELRCVGNSYIKFKGTAEISLSIISRKDFLTIGGKYFFNAPLNELKNYYLVKTKNTKVFQNGKIQIVQYEYQLTNSFDTENELNYFDNQRSKTNGNIAQGEYISRNIDIENTANIIFNNLQIEELNINGDNTLEDGLEMPLDG